jgi:hypothetical protein
MTDDNGGIFTPFFAAICFYINIIESRNTRKIEMLTENGGF